MLPPDGECVWACGSNAPFDTEHIIGKHVATALNIPFPVPMAWGGIHRQSGLRVERGERMEAELRIVLRDRVCKRCNGGWMRKLDRAMLNFMWNTLRHEARAQLGEPQQKVLARWTTKVALLLCLYTHDEARTNPEVRQPGDSYAPGDNFRDYFMRSKPPGDTQLWIGALSPATAASDFFMAPTAIHIRERPHGPIEPCGYHIAFALRRLVFFASGWELTRADAPFADPSALVSDRRSMVRLWPTRERTIEWPPPRYLSADDLDKLARG